MSKKHFIALADMIREHNRIAKHGDTTAFTFDQIDALASWCKGQNADFKRDRWLDYVNGDCGPNGGAR